MKTIQIKSLRLLNFKGIRKLEINDFKKETNIFGANGTGKTTVFDAFTWLLFGKDSTERTAFEIKTLNKNNQEIPKIDHEVEAVISVDGEDINLRRTFRDKWVKKRGSIDSEFNGNETLYHWNDVPVTAGEFVLKITSLVKESVFKLITSPSAFNSLKWQEQRQVLIDISGGVTDEEIAAGNSDFESLLSKLTNKTLEEYEKQIKATIRKAKEELGAIPTRIDEVERGKPAYQDFNLHRTNLAVREEQLKDIEGQITDKLKAQLAITNKRSELQKEIQQLEEKLSDVKHQLKLQAKAEFQKQGSKSSDIETKIAAKNEELSKAKRLVENLEVSRKSENDEISNLERKNTSMREEWNKRNAEVFEMDDADCKCPTCKRAFEAEDVEAKKKELFANFQQNKMNDLEAMNAKGKANKSKIETAKQEVKILEGRINKGKEVIEYTVNEIGELTQALEAVNDNSEVISETIIASDMIAESKEVAAIESQVVALKETLSKVQGVDVEALNASKESKLREIEESKAFLKDEEQINSANNRIKSLEEEESKLSQQIMDYEKDQFAIENFNKAKMDALEGKINDRFKMVNFKLFDTQVNGGESPTCKALINGVPFTDANTASKINAGIDIINTLCDHYQVSAPIFIDNRESVVQLIPSESQIVNLIVSAEHTALKVEAGKSLEPQTV